MLAAQEKQGRGKSPSKYFERLFYELPSWSDVDLSTLTFEAVKQINLKREYSFTSHITVAARDLHTAGGNIFYLELAVDSTEFIKLHDFDASEEIDPDAIMAQTNQATANANRPAAGTGDDDETAALLKSLGM